MRAARATIGTTSTSVHDWRELALREGDGLHISLLWSKSADRVKVSVLDERKGQSFDLDVPSADALNAFHHPFAYAAGRGHCFGDPSCVSLELQTQS
jgi:hypothetical protein